MMRKCKREEKLRDILEGEIEEEKKKQMPIDVDMNE